MAADAEWRRMEREAADAKAAAASCGGSLLRASRLFARFVTPQVLARSVALEGRVQEGESQLGCKVSCRRFAPDCVPKLPPKPERELQNGSPNEPKSSKMGSLGESWGHLWPTWVPKRLLERQVGAKMGQAGSRWAKRRQVELPGAFLEHSYPPLGAKVLVCWNTCVSYTKTFFPPGK